MRLCEYLNVMGTCDNLVHQTFVMCLLLHFPMLKNKPSKYELSPVISCANLTGFCLEFSHTDLSSQSDNNDESDDCESMRTTDESDANSEYDGESEDAADEDEEDRELMIACGQRQGRWERWEDLCREALGDNTAMEMLSHEETSAQKQQVCLKMGCLKGSI